MGHIREKEEGQIRESERDRGRTHRKQRERGVIHREREKWKDRGIDRGEMH